MNNITESRKSGVPEFRLTILESTDPSRPLNKKITINPDGTWHKKPYRNAKWFRRHLTPPLRTIQDLAAVLPAIMADPSRCIVTGAPCGPIPLKQPARRLLHPDGDHPATLEGQRSYFLPVDLDGILVPGADVLEMPELAVQRAIEALGAEFEDVSVFWQFSAGQRPDSEELRLRLFFVTARPHSPEELERWAKGLKPRGVPVDPAVYRAAQVIYTAAPAFAHGHDPIERRFGFLELGRDTVSLTIPPADQQEGGSTAGGGTAEGGTDFEGWLARIGDHEGGEGFNGAITRAIAAYCARLDPKTARAQREALKARMRAAIDAAPKASHRSQRDIGRYKSNRYLDPAVNGAIRKFAKRPEPPEPALTPEDEKDLKKDLKILAGCTPRNARPVACKIIRRYIKRTPRKFTLAELLGNIRECFIGTGRDWARVERFALWLEGRLRREALEAVSIDRERLAKLPNIAFERWTMDDIPRLPEEIISDYERGERPFVLLKWPMGSGKTTKAMRPIAQHPKLANTEKLAATHRQSLVSDLCCRCGFDDYREIKPNDLSATAGLGICINSLANPKFAPFVFNTRVALFDEITQSLREILNPNGTIAARQENRAIWNYATTIMDQSGIVIGCDADLDTLTITALAAALPNRKIRVIEIPENCADLVMEFATRRQAWDAIFKTLDSGQRVLIPTDGAKEVQKLEALIKKRYPGKRGLAIHSQPGTSTIGTPDVQQLLKNINEGVQELDYLIYSPAVLSGVSLEVPHFDAVVGLFHGAVIPADFIQMLRRDRTQTRFLIGFCGRCADSLETDPALILDNLDKTHKRVIETARDETGFTLRYTYASPFDELVCQAQAQEATARNNAANNLIYLLEARGYRVARSQQAAAGVSLLSEAKTLQRKSYDTALRDGEDITHQKRGDLKTEYQLTPEESAAAARFDLKQTLGLAPEDDLTDADLELWDQGAVAPKVRRYEAARQPIAAAARTDRDEADADLPLSCRKHRLGEAEAIHTAFEALGIDRTTGQGEITAETALDAWRSLKVSVVAPVLEHFRLCRFARHEPARPVVWASDFLSKFNLTLECLARPGARGDQQRVYTITAESWQTMAEVFQRRKSVSSSCVKSIPIPATGYACVEGGGNE